VAAGVAVAAEAESEAVATTADTQAGSACVGTVSTNGSRNAATETEVVGTEVPGMSAEGVEVSALHVTPAEAALPEDPTNQQ
jgi:hypothetical protein